MSTLVLLVGTNPLPNYVTARYLLEIAGPGRPTRVVLIHTDDTKGIATRLQRSINALKPGQGTSLYCLSRTDLLNGDLIYNAASRFLRDVTGTVHLNYTGGTKAMAVHCYRAVADADARPTFSYLNHGQFQLRYDDGAFAPRLPSGAPGDLRDIVTLELETLLQLHGCEDITATTPTSNQGSAALVVPVAGGSQVAQASLTVEALREMASRPPFHVAGNAPPHFEDFRSWKTKLRRSSGNQGARASMREWPAVADATPPWPLQPEFGALALSVQADFNLSPSATWASMAPEQRLAVGELLDFRWLEDVVFDAVARKIGDQQSLDPPVTRCYGNVRAKRGDSKNVHAPELDVVVLRGYELILLSCTTAAYHAGDDHRGDIKRKAFEALHRAEQFGGEEARAIVVSLCEDSVAQGVLRDLRNDYGTGRLKLSIISRQDLNHLDTALEKAIKG